MNDEPTEQEASEPTQAEPTQTDEKEPVEAAGKEEQPPTEKPEESPRDKRRKDFRSRQAIQQEADRYFRETQELRRQISELTKSQQGLTSRLERAIPEAPDPHREAIRASREKVKNMLNRLAKDPGAYDDYEDAQDERSRALFRAEMAQVIPTIMQQIQGSIPQQRHPAIQSLYMEFPWAEEYNESIAGLVNALRKRENLDFSDDKVKFATVRKATVMLGKQLGLLDEQRPRAPFAPAGHPAPVEPADPTANLNMKEVDEQSEFLFPGEPPEQRRAKWLKLCAPHLRQ